MSFTDYLSKKSIVAEATQEWVSEMEDEAKA